MAGTTDTIHILHVDDEPDFADLAATFLEREDDRFDVETATSASEGLANVETATYDCVVADHDMPGENGIEFLKGVREEYPELPFILYTGKGSEEVASEAISAGVTEYLQKEGGTSQYTVLANRIRNAVEKYHAQTELADREKRLNLFFEQSPLGVIEWDENFSFVQLNAAAEQILGYNEDALVGRSWDVIVPESDHEPVDEVVADLLENSGGYRSVNENVRENGERIVCEWHNRVVTDDSGDVVAVFSQFQDITERKEQEHQRQQIIDRVTDAIVEIDANWEFTLVNDHAEKLYEMDESYLLGRNFWEVFGEAQNTRIEEEYRQVMETREPTSFVEYFSQLDGWFDTEVYPKADGGIAFYFVEVTDQRERQQELEQANTVLSKLFETLPLGILAEDSDRNVLAVNDHLFELFDLPGSPDELEDADCEQIAEQVSEMFVDSNQFVERINDLVANREVTDSKQVPLRDGRTFERSYRPIELPGGMGHLWVYRDVTERADLEQQLEALNHIAQELMSADTQDEIVEIGIETTRDLLGMDANAIHLYDEDADALVPVAATDAVYDLVGEPPAFSGEDSIAWRVYQRGEPLAVDDVHADPDRYDSDTAIRSEVLLPLGEYGILLAGSPSPEMFDDQDVLLGEILTGGLATALEQAERTEQLRSHERELTKQNDRLEEFASIVSHDLRNPLNVAEGRLELAAAECDSEQLAHVEQAHERMRTLIEDLLSLAREGEAVTDVEPVALGRLVEGCWATVETAAATLVTDTDRIVQADKSRLKQLFENLMRNAVEHGGEDVTVTVGALDDGFYVEDDGPGISADERDDVFEAGYSTSEDGTGFGLSIVKQIVEAHDWQIRVTDGTAGGTKFEISGVEATAD